MVQVDPEVLKDPLHPEHPEHPSVHPKDPGGRGDLSHLPDPGHPSHPSHLSARPLDLEDPLDPGGLNIHPRLHPVL